MPGEDVHFNRIYNIIYTTCDRDDLKEWAVEALRIWKEGLGRVPDEIDQHFHQVNTSVDEAIEKLFYGYGGLFHVDINDPDEQEKIHAIEESLLHHAIANLFAALKILDCVIIRWLDDPGLKTPPVPERADAT